VEDCGNGQKQDLHRPTPRSVSPRKLATPSRAAAASIP
jgi:hypothetical protein